MEVARYSLQRVTTQYMDSARQYGARNGDEDLMVQPESAIKCSCETKDRQTLRGRPATQKWCDSFNNNGF